MMVILLLLCGTQVSLQAVKKKKSLETSRVKLLDFYSYPQCRQDFVDQMVNMWCGFTSDDHVNEIIRIFYSHVANNRVERVKELLDDVSLSEDVKNILIRYQGPLECTDNNAFTAFQLAVVKNYIEMARLLVQYGANINFCDLHGNSTLCLAVNYGLYDMVAFLLSHDDISVNVSSPRGLTPLIVAVTKGDVAMVRALLVRKDIEINAFDCIPRLEQNSNKGSFLHIKRLMVHINYVRHGKSAELLQEVSVGGNNFFHSIAEVGNPIDVVNVPASAMIMAQPNDAGDYPIHTAIKLCSTCKNPDVFGGYQRVIRMFLHTDRASLNYKTKLGLTPLHIAAHGNFGDLILLLLRCGADPDAEALLGGQLVTPRTMAERTGHLVAFNQLAELTLQYRNLQEAMNQHTNALFATAQEHVVSQEVLMRAGLDQVTDAERSSIERMCNFDLDRMAEAKKQREAFVREQEILRMQALAPVIQGEKSARSQLKEEEKVVAEQLCRYQQLLRELPAKRIAMQRELLVFEEQEQHDRKVLVASCVNECVSILEQVERKERRLIDHERMHFYQKLYQECLQEKLCLEREYLIKAEGAAREVEVQLERKRFAEFPKRQARLHVQDHEQLLRHRVDRERDSWVVHLEACQQVLGLVFQEKEVFFSESCAEMMDLIEVFNANAPLQQQVVQPETQQVMRPVMYDVGSDPMPSDSSFKQVFDYAVCRGNVGLVSALLFDPAAAGFLEFPVTGQAGKTPLFVAIEHGDYGMVQCLLYYGARAACNGYTPLAWAEGQLAVISRYTHSPYGSPVRRDALVHIIQLLANQPSV